MPENCSCVFSENAVRWVYEIKGVGRLSYAGLRCAGENIRLYRRRVSAGTGTGRCAGVPQVLRAEPLRQLRCASGLPAGTVEEMTAVMQRYKTALVLMIETTPFDYRDTAEQKTAKKHQNVLTEQLMAKMQADGLTDLLMMGAGPWKHAPCMSAYCVDAKKMADAVHMKCWANDGKIRYFSLILF